MSTPLEQTLEDHFNKPSKIQKIIKDSGDKQTTNKVLDLQTLRILNTLQEFIEIGSCVQSGKEANIYEGILKRPIISKYIIKETIEKSINEPNKKIVIKIYRTSTMEFKKRNPYLSEKFENITNSRKLIKIWAEKEMRNLKRLQNVKIPSPSPLFLKRNVLVLEMIMAPLIGENIELLIAPRLKDLNKVFLQKINGSYREIYIKVLDLIYSLYNEAKIVHADLSEYNLLFSNDIYVIDVSQSVDIFHENALRLLIMDITNINNFFIKKGIEIVPVKDVFEKVTGKKVNIDVLTETVKVIQHLKDGINGNYNKKDLESFLKTSIIENSGSINSESSEDKEIKRKKTSEFDISKLSKEEIKERRKKLKEIRKTKRMSKNKKIQTKQKNKKKIK